MNIYGTEKASFFRELSDFAGTLKDKITRGGEWNMRCFIDIFRNIYAMPPDSKVISKVLEIHLSKNWQEDSHIYRWEMNCLVV